MNVDILLATYNGKLYLAEQIHSLLNQTYQNFKIIIRDDGSTDGSKEIIAQFANQYPDKITLLPSQQNCGIKENFSLLLQASQADFTFFCDQDDVWLKEKIALTLNAARKEASSIPLLVHTDLKVVDSNLQAIASSFWDYQGLKPLKTSTFNRLLIQNTVTGCTMMINKSLRKRIGSIPAEALMHDWWIALIASAFGKIITVPLSTILYRQHASNTLGAQKLNLRRLFLKACSRAHLDKAAQDTVKRHLQRAAFYNYFQDELSLEQKKTVEALLSAPTSSWLENKRKIYRYGFYRNSLLHNVAGFFLRNPF